MRISSITDLGISLFKVHLFTVFGDKYSSIIPIRICGIISRDLNIDEFAWAAKATLGQYLDCRNIRLDFISSA